MARKKVNKLNQKVQEFAELMSETLNNADEDLSTYSPMELHNYLDGKRYQLFRELQNGIQADNVKVSQLAVEVANLALVIADKHKGE